MADDEGEASKRPKGVDLAQFVGDDRATGRLRDQIERMKALSGSGRALKAALGPTNAVQRLLETHRSAIDATRILPEVSALAGIAEAARMANSYRLPEIAGIGALGEASRSVFESFRVGSLVDMFGTQSALAAFSSSLSLLENDTITRMLEGVRAHQIVFDSAISAYMDQHRAQAERIASMAEALAMPRVDPARLGIGSALALGETNVFKLAGLKRDYVDDFRSATAALNERIQAFAGLGSAVEAFALRPDLVSGIGSLLERALAQQESLLEQQRQLAEQAAAARPRRQTLLAERLTIIAAIVTILQFWIFIALQIEERMTGGDPATLANTAAVEQNTLAIGKMRGSFEALSDQLEQMRTAQVDAGEAESAADAGIGEILREIADTLADKANGDDETP